MVQMKVTAAALIAAAAIAPAVAQSYYAEDSLATREDYNDVDDLLARDYDLELEERDFYDNEDDLFVREPMFGFNHLRKWLRTKKTMPPPQQYGSDASIEAREFDDEDLLTRELEEMFERDPFMGMGKLRSWWKNRKAAKQQSQDGYSPDVQARQYDDEDLLTRELEEMFERDPFMGLGKLRSWWKNRKAAKQQSQQDAYSPDATAREFDDEELYTREFEDDMEIEAREPEAEYEEVLSRYFDDLYERELATAEEEFLARDFEDEEAELAARNFEGEDAELVAREPGFLEWIKGLFHHKKPEEAKAKEQKADSADAEAREFEEFDELD